MPSGSQAIDRAAIFRPSSPRRLCAHRENGTVNMDLSVNLNIWTLELDRLGYLEPGFVHVLPEMSGLSFRFSPSFKSETVFDHRKS